MFRTVVISAPASTSHLTGTCFQPPPLAGRHSCPSGGRGIAMRCARCHRPEGHRDDPGRGGSVFRAFAHAPTNGGVSRLGERCEGRSTAAAVKRMAASRSMQCRGVECGCVGVLLAAMQEHRHDRTELKSIMGFLRQPGDWADWVQTGRLRAMKAPALSSGSCQPKRVTSSAPSVAR
jgi:hypothetical protein